MLVYFFIALSDAEMIIFDEALQVFSSSMKHYKYFFNLRCKKNNVLPKSLKIKPPIQTQEAFQIAKNTGRKYL